MRNHFVTVFFILVFMICGTVADAATHHEMIHFHNRALPLSADNAVTLSSMDSSLNKTRLSASGGYDLPMLTQTFTYPRGTKVHGIEVISLENSDTPLTSPLTILPAKPTINGAPPLKGSVTNYLMSAESYPHCWYELDVRQGLDPFTMTPTVFATVRLYPVRLSGSTMSYLTDFNARLNVTPAAETDNRGDATMMIIAPQEFLDEMSAFITHKTNTGLQILTRSLEDIYANVSGRDEAEKIKSAVANAYQQNPIGFLLLAGDADRLPVRYTFHSEYGGSDDWQNIPADLYYADLWDGNGGFCDWDGNENDIFGEYQNGNVDHCDFAPDVVVGRIPASTVAELTGAINKIIHYETTVTGSEPWQDRIILAAADTFTASEHGDITGVPEGEATKELIASESLSSFDLVKLYETERYPRTGELTTESLNTAILNGAQYVNFANHGWVQGWAFEGGYSVTEVDALDNFDHLPVAFGYACSTGVFDTENPVCPSYGVDKCLAEAFILNANGGAVGYYGSSRTAFAGGHGLGGHLGAFGLLDREVFSAVGQGHTVQGRIWQYALLQLLNGKGLADPADFITMLECHYFGDPSTAAGGTPTAPDFKETYLGMVDVTGDGDGCAEPGEDIELSIIISNFGQSAHNVQATLTTTSTNITLISSTANLSDLGRGAFILIDPLLKFSVNPGCPLESVHDFTLTISSDEGSYTTDFQIYVGEGAYIKADTLWITQDSNNDNLANPGESIKFAPGLLNVGCSTATGVVGSITIDDPWVVEYGVRGSGVCPDLEPRVQTIPQKLFQMDLDPMTPDGHIVTCDVSLTDPETDTTWDYTFEMTVNDTVMPVISDFTVSPVTPDPGEEATITVRIEDPAGVKTATLEIHSYELDESITAEFFDDGQHNDGAAGDMIFGARILLPEMEGYLSADIFAEDNLDNAGTIANAGGVVTEPFISDDKILVIGRADNDLNIGLYTQALDDAGYGYDVWSYYRGLPTQDILQNYIDGAIIMYYSFTYPYLDQTERDLVAWYLEQGGNLLITEQDIGWVMVEAGTTSMTQWYNDVLLANYLEDNAGFQAVQGTSDFADLNFSLSGGSGADNQDYPSLIEPISPAETCFVYDDGTGPQPGAAGIRAERNGARHIYLAFGFEGIAYQQDRADAMDEMMQWFGMEKTEKMVPFNQIPGSWLGPELPTQVIYATSAFCESNMRIYQAGGLDAVTQQTGDPSIMYIDTSDHSSGDTGVDLITARYYHVTECLDDHGTEKIFFAGGIDEIGGLARTVEAYDPVTNTITEYTNDPLPVEFDGIPGGSIAAGNKLYIIGMARMSEPFQDGRTWVFDPMAEAGERWSVLDDILDEPRFFGATARLGNTLYLMGGIQQISQTEITVFDTVSVCDISAANPVWSDTTATAMPRGMFFNAAVGVPRGTNVEKAGQIFVAGGFDDQNENSAFWYDAATDTWAETWPLQNQRMLISNLQLTPKGRGPAIWALGGHYQRVYQDTEIRYLGDDPTTCWIGIRTYPETIPPGCSLRVGLDIAGNKAATPVDCYIAMDIAGSWFFITSTPTFPTFTSDPLPFFAGVPLPESITYCGPILEIPFPDDIPAITGTFYAANLVSGTADLAGGLSTAEFIVP